MDKERPSRTREEVIRKQQAPSRAPAVASQNLVYGFNLLEAKAPSSQQTATLKSALSAHDDDETRHRPWACASSPRGRLPVVDEMHKGNEQFREWIRASQEGAASDAETPVPMKSVNQDYPACRSAFQARDNDETQHDVEQGIKIKSATSSKSHKRNLGVLNFGELDSDTSSVDKKVESSQTVTANFQDPTDVKSYASQVGSGSSKFLKWFSDDDSYTETDTYKSAVEENDIVEALALHNYEVFHNIRPGSIHVSVVRGSSAGVVGWASCHVDDHSGVPPIPPSNNSNETAETSSSPSESSAGSNAADVGLHKKRKRKGDEYEEMQLRVALLRSMGVHAECPQNSLDPFEGSIDGKDGDTNDEYEVEEYFDTRKDEWFMKQGKEAVSSHGEKATPLKKLDEKDREVSEAKGGDDTSDKTDEPTGKVLESGVDSAKSLETTAKNGDKSDALQNKEKGSHNQIQKRNHSSVADSVGSCESLETVVDTPSGSTGNVFSAQESEASDNSYVCVKTDQEESDDEKESFVVVEAAAPPSRPHVNRSTWQWRNLVHHVQQNANTNAEQSIQDNDCPSDDSTDYNHCT